MPARPTTMLSPRASSTNSPTLASSSLVSFPANSGRITSSAPAATTSRPLVRVRLAPSSPAIRARAWRTRPRPSTASAPEATARPMAPFQATPPRLAYSRSVSASSRIPSAKSTTSDSSTAAPATASAAVTTARRLLGPSTRRVPPAAPRPAPIISQITTANDVALPKLNSSSSIGLQFTSGSRKSKLAMSTASSDSPPPATAPHAAPPTTSWAPAVNVGTPSRLIWCPTRWPAANGRISSVT